MQDAELYVEFMNTLSQKCADNPDPIFTHARLQQINHKRLSEISGLPGINYSILQLAELEKKLGVAVTAKKRVLAKVQESINLN